MSPRSLLRRVAELSDTERSLVRDRLPAVSKLRTLFDHFADVADDARDYVHADAVAAVYGRGLAHDALRRANTALRRVSDNLASKVDAIHVGRTFRHDEELLLLDDAEQRYYSARRLANDDRTAEALDLLLQNLRGFAEDHRPFPPTAPVRHRAADTWDESFIAQNTALLLRIVERAEPGTNLVPDLTTRVAAAAAGAILAAYDVRLRAALEPAYNRQPAPTNARKGRGGRDDAGSSSRRSIVAESGGELADLDMLLAEVDSLAALPLMAPYHDVIEMFRLSIEAERSMRLGDWRGLVSHAGERGENSDRVHRLGLRFPGLEHGARIDRLNARIEAAAIEALANDDIDTASICLGSLAQGAIGEPTARHRHISAYVNLLLAQGLLEEVGEWLRVLIDFDTSTAMERQLAEARFYEARFRLYQHEPGDANMIFAAIERYERLVNAKMVERSNVLRAKAKWYFRFGADDDLLRCGELLGNITIDDPQHECNGRFVRLLISAAEHRRTHSAAAARAYCIKRREFLVPNAGTLHAMLFMARWLAQFVETGALAGC